MIRRVTAAAILCVVLSACDSGPRPEPVVVYATIEGESYLPELFSAFTRKTGIPVTLRYETSATNTANVIAAEGSPPADVLLTGNVADIWHAADEGALRPIQAENLKTSPARLRDPDGFWAALQFRLAVIVKDARASDAAEPSPRTYADLAGQDYRDRLCLTSSARAVNRSLIAMLIADLGARPAELLVRGWIQNLALPPFDTELQLLNAIRSGACGVGIVSGAGATGAEIVGVEIEGVEIIVPDGAAFDIDGFGIARHARYPESAQRLVDWMLAEKVLQLPASAKSHNVGIAGWGDEDARKLAERAGYR